MSRTPAAALKRFLLAAVLAISCGACTPQQQLLMSLLPDGTIPVFLSNFQQVGDTNRRRIAEFEQRRDWDGLVRFAEENVKLDKTNSDWWIVSGYAYSQAGKRREAIASYGEAIRITPEDALAWNLLANSYRLDGQPERALQVVDRALNINRNTPATWILQGEIYSDLGRFQPAVGAYQEALKLDQGLGQAWLGMGKAYARLGRNAEVKEVAKVLENLDPPLAKELAASTAR